MKTWISMLLALHLLTGCNTLALGQLKQRYPIQNGRTWIKPPAPTPAVQAHQQRAALVFGLLAGFTVIAVQLWSNAEWRAAQRRAYGWPGQP